MPKNAPPPSTLWVLTVAAVCLCILCCAVTVSGQVFMSTTELSHLVGKEEDIFRWIDNYIDTEITRLKALKRRASQIPRLTPSQAKTNVQSPLSAYQAVKKFSLVWKKLAEALISPTWSAPPNISSTKVSRDLHFNQWPGKQDLEGAAAALVRLQRTYGLVANDLQRGRVLQFSPTAPLDSNDCYLIGLEAEKTFDWLIVIEWMTLALKNIDKQSLYRKTDVLMSLANAHLKLEQTSKAVEFAARAVVSDPHNKDNNAILKEYKSVKAACEYEPEDTPRAELSVYERLCRGEIKQDEAITRTLFCRYKLTDLPYIVVKEEVLYHDPFISLFHDVISDREAELLVEMASTKMHQAYIGQKKESDMRISQVGWVGDETAGVENISRRIKDITGLDTTMKDKLSNAEKFQVVTYGIGGMYKPHYDAFGVHYDGNTGPDYLRNTGDRIATWMFYLTDVEAGGATVFPAIKVAVPPVKNAAVFWYNIKRDGRKDTYTIHAGCPVLHGHKIVANKWIRSMGQLFHRRCGLDRNSSDS